MYPFNFSKKKKKLECQTATLQTVVPMTFRPPSTFESTLLLKQNTPLYLHTRNNNMIQIKVKVVRAILNLCGSSAFDNPCKLDKGIIGYKPQMQSINREFAASHGHGTSLQNLN